VFRAWFGFVSGLELVEGFPSKFMCSLAFYNSQRNQEFSLLHSILVLSIFNEVRSL